MMEFVISMIAVIISIATFLVTVFIARRTEKRAKKQATLDAINTLQEQVFDKLNEYSANKIYDITTTWVQATKEKKAYTSKKKGTADDFFASHPEYKDIFEVYREISSYLARIEHFALGVNTDIYDAEVTERATTKYFILLYYKIRPILAVKNGGKVDDKVFDNKYHKEFETLIRHLQEIEKKGNV